MAAILSRPQCVNRTGAKAFADTYMYKYQLPALVVLCEGNPPVTGGWWIPLTNGQ